MTPQLSASHSRRLLLLLIVMISLVALTLSSCSSDTPKNTAYGETRTVVDIENTEVEVPVNPQRVVALSEPTLDAVLALGVTPVGAVAGRGQQGVSAYLADQAGDVPVLGSVSEVNFEAIGGVQPDLILVDGTSINNNPPVIAALREIAPVVYTGYAGGDWIVNLQFVADALNMRDKGQQLIDAYHAHVDQAKQELTSYADSTFSIVRWQGNSASLILKELPAGRALTDLGLRRPANQDKEGRGHSEPVSAENIADIDADYLFFGTLGGSSVGNPNAGGEANATAAQDALLAAEDVPGFSSFKAYQLDHIIPVDGSLWTSTGGPILMSKIIDDVTAAL